jgi:NADPH-dependent curcumin reductase CurA
MTSTAATKNGQFRLKSRPTGRVSTDNFEYRSEPLKELSDGEVLVRVVYLSLDPTNRIWMSDVEQYMPPVQIGEVMRGLGVGKVISSKNQQFKEGDYVSGLLGWQEYLVSNGAGAFPLFKLPDVPVPLQVMAGAAGMTGWTAYFGLLDLGQPKKGETLVVSAAAGAVGSVVGQIGKIHGLRVVGIAGGDDKCRWLKDELGFDAVVDRKKASWKHDLTQATPQGIDINFENAGGEIMEAVYERMNLHSRFVLCGMIAGYNDADDSKTRISLSGTLMKRIRIQGFIVTDFAARTAEATQKLLQWIAEGKIKHKETIVDGLDKAPEALNMLFEGSNVGKLLIKVSEP